MQCTMHRSLPFDGMSFVIQRLFSSCGVYKVAIVYLANFPSLGGPEVRLPIFVRHSSLRLPYRPICPVIMVGPGTGVAPFRGFIQDRSSVKKEGVCVCVLVCEA